MAPVASQEERSMEYSIKTPNDVAAMVANIQNDTRAGKHKVTVTLVIEAGEIKKLNVE